jgi:hypothetical protein
VGVDFLLLACAVSSNGRQLRHEPVLYFVGFDGSC